MARISVGRACARGLWVWSSFSAQAVAAEESAKLDTLEEECTDLSNQLQESEAALAETQEMERKCSREYIAYEKAIAKKNAAKANKGKGRFGS